MTDTQGRLLDDDETFERLNIKRGLPEAWEDGRRSSEDLAAGEWEWWYLDAHFTNGYFAVASMNIKADASGVNRPFLSLNITKGPEKLVDRIIPVDKLTAAKDRADVRIGNSVFESTDGLDNYHVFIDPAEHDGDGIDLELTRTIPSYRPGTGRWEAAGNHFSWLCAVPGGTIKGTLYVSGEAIEVEGNGYHDHNWGDVPMDYLLGDWLWGRAEVDGTTVVSASVRFRELAGGRETPLLYVARPDQILADAINDDLTCLEGVKVPHPDTGKPISSDCIYLVDEGTGAGSNVRFNGNGRIVASFPFSNSSKDWQTWYARYLADVSIDICENDGSRLTGSDHGTLEVMDFFGRATERH
jgi:hypothetical protein